MTKNNDHNLLDSTYDEMTEFEEFFKKNWVNIISVGGIIVILIVAAIQLKSWLDKYDSKAGAALSSAKTIEEIEAVLKKYPRHKAADFSKLHLASLYFETGNSQKSTDILTKLAKTTKTKELAAQAELNLATIILQNGKIEYAAEKFSSIGGNQKFSPYYRIEAKVSAAMLYLKAGKTALAKNAIETSSPEEIEIANSHQGYQRAKTILSSL